MYKATQTVPFVSGHTTDLVIDSGDVVLIYEDYTLRPDILRLSVRDVAESLTTSAEMWIAWDITENLCFLVVDCDTELKSTAGSQPVTPLSSCCFDSYGDDSFAEL